MKKRFGTVLTAGTFDCLHKGHLNLLATALSRGKRLLIGLSSDSFAKKHRRHKVFSFGDRKKMLSELLAHRHASCSIFKLSSPTEPAASMKRLDALVASEETRGMAEKINALRKKRRLKPLYLIIIPTVYAEDLLPISCERISACKIDSNGKRTAPLDLAVGSGNPAKLKPIQATAEKIFQKIPWIRVSAVPVKTKIPRQPFGIETMKGAEQRARLAFAKSGDCDYGIGLESGLFKLNNKAYDFLWACVFDGRTSSFGCSMGFELPEKLARLAKPSFDLSQAFEKLTGEKDIGKKEGILGRISGGLATRPEMVEQALRMAFVPRIDATSGKESSEP